MFELSGLSFFWMLAPLPALAFVKNKSQEAIVLILMLSIGFLLVGYQAFEFSWATERDAGVEIIAIALALVASFANKERPNLTLILVAPFFLSAAISKSLLHKFICIFICDLIVIAEHFRKEKNATVTRHELWGAVFCLIPAAFIFVAPRVPSEVSWLILISIIFRTMEWPVKSWAGGAISGGGASQGLFFTLPAIILWFATGAKGDPLWPLLFLGLMGFFTLGRGYYLPILLGGLSLLGRTDALFSLGMALPFVAMATEIPLFGFVFMICAGALALTSLASGLTMEVEIVLAVSVGALVGRFFIRQPLFKKPNIKDIALAGIGTTFMIYSLSQFGFDRLSLSSSAGGFIGVAVIVLSVGHAFWKTKKISLGFGSFSLAEKLFEKFKTRPQKIEDSPLEPHKLSGGGLALTFESEFWAYLGFGLLGLLLFWSLL